MPIFHEFPYGNMHDQNYDWILKVVKDFFDKYNNVESLIQQAVDAINEGKTEALEEIDVALTAALNDITSSQASALNAIGDSKDSALASIATALGNATDAISTLSSTAQTQITTLKNTSISEITTAQGTAISAITASMNHATTVIEQLYNTLPASAQDILGKLQLLDNIITGNTPGSFTWLQGCYVYPEGETPPTPPAIWTNDPAYNQKVSSLYMTGIGGRRIRIITDGTIYITSILTWRNTPPGGGAGGYVPGQASWFTNTYADILLPFDVTAFSIELAKPNPADTISPTDITGHIEIQWITDFVSQRIIAPKESSSTADVARETGEYFFLDGDLYIATDDIAISDTIAEGTNCEKKTVGGELSELNSNTESIESAINYSPLIINLNKSIDTHPANPTIKPGAIKTESDWCCVCISCVPGDIFNVTGKGGYTTRLWSFADSNGVLLTESESGAAATHAEVVAPANAAYFAYNSQMSVAYDVWKGIKPKEAIASLEEFESNVNKTEIVKNVSFDNKQTGYVQADGTIGTAGAFKYKPYFKLYAGETVTLTARGYLTAVAMIAEYVGSTTYRPLVMSSDSDMHDYTFTADRDMNIVLSFNSAYEYSAVVVSNIEKVIQFQSTFGYWNLFPKLAVIGDSLSSGVLVESQGSEVHVYGDSWLSYIARRTNAVSRDHYAEGGLTCATWITNYLSAMQNGETANAYFIALGTNDAYLETYPIGTIEDEAGDNSFVGYYKQIIGYVHTKAPNAAIFCVSNYNNNEKAHQYSEMISDIADLYDYCFYVDFINNTNIYTTTGSIWSNVGHFTTVGYNYVADVIYRLVNDIVINNYTFFKWFGKNNSSGGQYEN